MLQRIKNIFRRRKANPSQGGGKLYVAWLLILPVIIGLVSGHASSVILGYALEKLSGTAGQTNETATLTVSSTPQARTNGLEDFLAANPFHISPQKTAEAPAPAPQPEAPKPAKAPISLDNVVLRGTLPGIGAWLEHDGKLKLVLQGKNFERHRLISVKYDEAVFRRGRTQVTKYLTYGPLAEKKPPEPVKPAAPSPKPQPAAQGNVVAATETQEGQVPSELVNQLVQNPFDELKRIRMRPNDKSGGLEVQWIQNDSILKRLGVQRGDVIKSVNGIPFTNMGDIANSINSLMNSERFDVEVTRGGKSTALRYVVR